MTARNGNLVFTRKPGQGFFIGRGITVTVLDVGVDGAVRIGVQAPENVAVSRDDFSLAEHLRFQKGRERGARPYRSIPRGEDRRA